jgi:hypothetical protein
MAGSEMAPTMEPVEKGERKIKKYITGANGEARPIYEDEDEAKVAAEIQQQKSEMR